MIHPDFYVLGGAHEVMAPFRECEHDCKQLLVVDFVVLIAERDLDMKTTGCYTPFCC